MTKYPTTVGVIFTEKETEELEEVCQQLDLPRSTLIRRIWRDWYKSRSGRVKELAMNKQIWFQDSKE